MSRRLLLACSLVALLGAPLAAQDAPPTPSSADTVFLRARRLVADGQSNAGRLLVDSLLRATPTTSPVYPEALYWRAVVASTAADAERDYRRVAIEFSTSERASEALLRLAQLEIARGDRGQAIDHLQRLISDHPTSPVRASASYWLADQLFTANSSAEIPRACAALADARAGVEQGNVELKNQIEFYHTRCTTGASATDSRDSASPTSPPLRDSTPTRPSVPRETPPSVSRRATQPAQLPSATRVDPPAAAPTTTRTFTVQVAAYDTEADAARLVKQLKDRGFEARIEGGAAPFRVRVGRYATRAAAAAAAESMKAKKIYGFVAESGSEAPRP